jgi:hypothetical protein
VAVTVSTVVHVFDGLLEVDYGQAYVISGGVDDTGDLPAGFKGQSNGLLAAATPGLLFLLTSRSSGNVRLDIDVWASERPLEEVWEECVEASFMPAGLPVRLVGWGMDFTAGTSVCEIPLEQRPYRVRYCARGMDAAWDLHALEPESAVDSYLLAFWPAPCAPDAIVKQTSDAARTMHRAFGQTTS